MRMNAETGSDRSPRAGERWWLMGALVVLGMIFLLAVVAILAQYQPGEATVMRRDVIAYESLAGEVLAPPNAMAVINCHCSAPVARVFATVGQTVSQGDVLVELSHPNAAASYETARQELQAAREAQEQAQRLYAAEVQQAETRLAEARAGQRLASQSGRTEVPASLSDDEAATPPASTGNLALAQAELNVAQAEAQLEVARTRYRDYLEPYQQRLAAAQKSFQEARAGRAQSFIRSPISGQVLELNARPGQPVDQVPDTLVATVADLSALRVHSRLDEGQRGRVRPGMPVVVRLPDLPQETFSGEVTQLTVATGSAVTNREHEIQQIAVLGFVNRQGLAKPGMNAHAMVEVDRAENTLTVPVAALQREADGEPFVRVREQGRWVQRPVQTGASDGVHVAVLSGLQDGNVVRVPRAAADAAETPASRPF